MASIVARDDYSKQLFDLTNWGGGRWDAADFKVHFYDEEDEQRRRAIPRYDADYLQAKRREVIIEPAPLEDQWDLELSVFRGGAWAKLRREAAGTNYARSGEDLTEALLRLAILLAKKGVVTKEEK